ncbi:uncharacterized protein [Panulirus ornatus]|uniref:uncharacterized protein isoform X2 n=1 Tax=Panulirus ornatus TaxID=150431 RepID=UPI003A87B0FB
MCVILHERRFESSSSVKTTPTCTHTYRFPCLASIERSYNPPGHLSPILHIMGNTSSALRVSPENGVQYYPWDAEEIPFYPCESQEPPLDDSIVNLYLPTPSWHDGGYPDEEEEEQELLLISTPPPGYRLVVMDDSEGAMTGVHEEEEVVMVEEEEASTPTPFVVVYEAMGLASASMWGGPGLLQALDGDATDLVPEEGQDGNGTRLGSLGKRNLAPEGLNGLQWNEETSSPEPVQDADRDNADGLANRPEKRKLLIDHSDDMSPLDQENMNSQPKYFKVEELHLGSSLAHHDQDDQERHLSSVRSEDELVCLALQEERAEEFLLEDEEELCEDIKE